MYFSVAAKSVSHLLDNYRRLAPSTFSVGDSRAYMGTQLILIVHPDLPIGCQEAERKTIAADNT